MENKQEHLYDQAVKQFLANKKLLAQILKGCVEEFRDCDVNDIANRYIEGVPEVSSVSYVPGETNIKPLTPGEEIQGMANDQTINGEGRRTFDIRFHAMAPKENGTIRIIVNVEAQKDYPTQYKLLRRAIYYCSRLISAQYEVDFEHNKFNKLCKVYSIWICSNPPTEWRDTITKYSLKEENIKGLVHANVEEYDLINVIILGLSPNGEESEKDLLYLLRTVLAEKQNRDTMMSVLREFGMQDDPKMKEEAEYMCNLSQGVRESGRREGLNEGITLGRNEGITLGRTEGKDIQAKQTALNMHKAGMAINVIAQMIGYAADTVAGWLMQPEA